MQLSVPWICFHLSGDQDVSQDKVVDFEATKYGVVLCGTALLETGNNETWGFTPTATSCG